MYQTLLINTPSFNLLFFCVCVIQKLLIVIICNNETEILCFIALFIEMTAIMN